MSTANTELKWPTDTGCNDRSGGIRPEIPPSSSAAKIASSLADQTNAMAYKTFRFFLMNLPTSAGRPQVIPIAVPPAARVKIRRDDLCRLVRDLRHGEDFRVLFPPGVPVQMTFLIVLRVILLVKSL